jgi:hypothetical protein
VPAPYTSYWTDSKEQVIAYAIQVMLAVMNYGFFQVCRMACTHGMRPSPWHRPPPSCAWAYPPLGGGVVMPDEWGAIGALGLVETGGHGAACCPQGNNAWWNVIEELKSKRDLAYLSSGMLRLISNRYKAANTWLPMSQKVPGAPLCWQTQRHGLNGTPIGACLFIHTVCFGNSRGACLHQLQPKAGCNVESIENHRPAPPPTPCVPGRGAICAALQPEGSFSRQTRRE